MAQKKQKAPAKMAMESAKLGAERVSKAAGGVFKKLMGHLDQKKIDAWQKKWLAMPENRKKYETIKDAPEVVGEELLEMTNDIIDFVQKKTKEVTPKKASKAPAKTKKTKKSL